MSEQNKDGKLKRHDSIWHHLVTERPHANVKFRGQESVKK